MQEVLSPPIASEVVSELTLARIELEREYRNATLSPREKAYELRLQMLESRAVSTDDKLEALQSKYGREKELAADLAHFTATILGRNEDVEAVMAGNTVSPLAYEPDLELEPEPPLLVPRCHTIALPSTTNGLLLRRQMVEVYFQIGKVGPEDRAYTLLLRALLAQPLFHELRTRQQLGYTVACSFSAHVQTLQRTYARPDSTLAEQSERFWEEIVSGRLEFDLDVQIANALGGCTRQGLLARPFKPIEQLVPPDKTPVIISGDLHDFKRELQCHCHIENANT
uniref:Coenzyme PQQ synthesis protein F-like C-terminal lobe domain-containing protein n=1 Tax=Phytophthora ramorum TaxID=164328 RepID=H3HDH2_PHYRM